MDRPLTLPMDGPTAHWTRLLDMSPEWDYWRDTLFRGDSWVLTTRHAADGTQALSELWYAPPQRPFTLWRRCYPRPQALTRGGLDEAHFWVVAEIVAGRLPPSA